MQASLLTAPGGSYFSSPLSVALSSYMEEPQCRAALLDALQNLAASPEIQRLAQPAAPDQQPETALVCSQLAWDLENHQYGSLTCSSLHPSALDCHQHRKDTCSRKPLLVSHGRHRGGRAMQAVLTVTTAAARAMSESDVAECRLVTQSLPLVAACLTAHYKELPATALSCLDALLGLHATLYTSLLLWRSERTRKVMTHGTRVPKAGKTM